MKVKDLIGHLQECPEDYEVCLSIYNTITEEDYEKMETKGTDEFGGPYQVCLDMPIWGVAQNDNIKEIRFVLGKSSVEAVEAMEDNMIEANAIGKKRELF